MSLELLQEQTILVHILVVCTDNIENSKSTFNRFICSKSFGVQLFFHIPKWFQLNIYKNLLFMHKKSKWILKAFTGAFDQVSNMLKMTTKYDHLFTSCVVVQFTERFVSAMKFPVLEADEPIQSLHSCYCMDDVELVLWFSMTSAKTTQQWSELVIFTTKKSRSTLQCTIQINKTGNDSHQINSRQFHVIPLSSSQPNADSLLAVSKYSTPSYMTAKHTWSPSQP